MERGEPVSGLGLEVGALVQQQPHHVTLAPLGSHVQRGDVVLQKIFRKLQKYNSVCWVKYWDWEVDRYNMWHCWHILLGLVPLLLNSSKMRV